MRILKSTRRVLSNEQVAIDELVDGYNKRARLLFIAGFVSFALLLEKFALHLSDGSLVNLLYIGAFVFIVTYLGLIWAFDFKVKKLTLFVLIPQSAFFVTLQALFVEAFFFQGGLDRIYERVLLVILFLLMAASAYFAFLMTNVFNVEQFRPLPLKQVAKTVSYGITVLSVYYITYVVLSLEIGFVWVFAVLAIAFLLSAVAHHFHYTRGSSLDVSLRILVLLVIAQLVAVGSVMLLGNRYELSALLPASIAFVVHGVLMYKQDETLTKPLLIGYLGLLVFVFMINMIFNVV